MKSYLNKYLSIALAALLSTFLHSQGLTEGRFAGDGLIVGLEYAVTNNPQSVKTMAAAFAETGMPGMKHLPDAVSWGKMQKGPDKAINYKNLDLFIREYQNNGFSELTIALKPHSRWGSKKVSRLKTSNASPKPEYLGHFKAWVSGIVERYDGDGIDDMEGLRWPVRYIEIGTEFSSYQPEPAAEYIETLRHAYQAAHQASENVIIGHAAFLTTPTDMDVDDPADYDSVWINTPRHDKHHDLADMRMILDNPDIFDVINLHNLGSPYEIEHLVRWVQYETAQRGYSKPIIISDTVPTSYIGWGQATDCEAKIRGVLAPPATEADRCRLADYFTKLTRKDKATLHWTRGFIAADHVQRTIIAAEQDIRLINLSFTGDLPGLTSRLARGAAGIAAWGGALNVNLFTGKLKEKYPLYYAIQQLMGHFNGYSEIQRITHENDAVRIYHLAHGRGDFMIAWLDPQKVVLPGDVSEKLVNITVPAARVLIEPVITEIGQSRAERRSLDVIDGAIDLTLTHRPVYILLSNEDE